MNTTNTYLINLAQIREVISSKKTPYSLTKLNNLCGNIGSFAFHRGKMKRALETKKYTIKNSREFIECFRAFISALTIPELSGIEQQFREHLEGSLKGIHVKSDSIEIEMTKEGMESRSTIEGQTQLGFLTFGYRLIQERYQFKLICETLYLGLDQRRSELEALFQATDQKTKKSEINPSFTESIAKLYDDSIQVLKELSKEIDTKKVKGHAKVSQKKLLEELKHLQRNILQSHQKIEKVNRAENIPAKVKANLSKVFGGLQSHHQQQYHFLRTLLEMKHIVKDETISSTIVLNLFLNGHVLDQIQNGALASLNIEDILHQHLDNFKFYFELTRLSKCQKRTERSLRFPIGFALPGLGDLSDAKVDDVKNKCAPLITDERLQTSKVQALIKNMMMACVEADLEDDGIAINQFAQWLFLQCFKYRYLTTMKSFRKFILGFEQSSKQQSQFGGILLPSIILNYCHSLYHVLCVLLDDKQDYIKTCVKDDFESYYIKSRGETYRMLDKCIGLALGENLTKEDILNLREHLKLLLTEKMANPTQTQHFDQLLKDIGNKLNIENELNLFCSEKVFLKIMTLPKIKNQSWNRQGMINTMSVVKNLI